MLVNLECNQHPSYVYMAPRRFFVSSDDGWQLAVFILEDVLSVKMDNASMVVFILGTHYPPGRTLVRLVMRLKYKDRHKTRYASGRTVLRNTS